MTIDTTINIGHLITLIGLFIALVTWGNSLKFEVRSIDDDVKKFGKRIENIESKIDKFTELHFQSQNLERRLDDLADRVNRVEQTKLSLARKGVKTPT